MLLVVLSIIDLSSCVDLSLEGNTRGGFYGYSPCTCESAVFFSSYDLSLTRGYIINCGGKMLTDMKIRDILENLAVNQSEAAFTTYLYQLDLSNNRLTKVPEKLRHFRNLQTIKLDSNAIRSLSSGDFDFINSTEQAREISLTTNYLQTIEQGAFQGIHFWPLL